MALANTIDAVTAGDALAAWLARAPRNLEDVRISNVEIPTESGLRSQSPAGAPPGSNASSPPAPEGASVNYAGNR